MLTTLPRREREIFEILCREAECSAAQVRDKMVDAPSYSAVRTMLSRLEKRGLVTHRVEDQAFIYSAPQSGRVLESAMRQFVRTFFQGSAASAATALLGLSKEISEADVAALQQAINEAKEEEDGR